MTYLRVKLACAVIGLFALSACASNNPDYTIVTEHVLDDALRETSGLVCDDTGFYSINDSGNPPSLFMLSAENGSSQEIPLSMKNHDWEALALSKSHLYVADIGNNGGKRKDLAIYKIDKANQSVVGQLTIEYQDNNIAKNQFLAHDFDAEALVFHDEQLVLFSKSWNSKVTRVYKLSPHLPHQELTPHTTIDGLTGLVTGASYNTALKHYFLVGYEAGAFNLSAPFVAILDQDFELIKRFSLQGYGQVEAVCYYQNDLWFTQEKTTFKPAKLVRLRLK